MFSHTVFRLLPAALLCCLALVLISCGDEPADPLSAGGSNERGLVISEAVTRPLTDFTSSQTPLWWYDTENPLYRLYSDYTGYYNAAYGLNLGTTFDGSIMEWALDDGTARVVITLHGKNVLTWVRFDTAPYQLVFGYNPTAIQGGATPALGECTLTWEFINSAPGAPIPFLGTTGKFHFNARAVGELRASSGLGADGIRGMAWTNQVGLIDGVKPNPPLDDGYPAEFVKIKRVEPRMVGKD